MNRRRRNIRMTSNTFVVVTVAFTTLLRSWSTQAFMWVPLTSISVHIYYHDRTSKSLDKIRSVSTELLATEKDDDDDTTNSSGNWSASKSDMVPPDILRRFTSPIIDDPGLPLTDVLVAQVIAPSLQIAWISIRHAPQPSWLTPIFDTSLLYTNRGTLLAPALIHGAALASCWITGALAAKAYERDAISPIQIKSSVSDVKWDYSKVILSIIKSGAFAIGLLIFATQIDLFLEYKRYVQVGESDEIDFRLLVALVEVINDVVFEAVTIATWRFFLAYQAERMSRD